LKFLRNIEKCHPFFLYAAYVVMRTYFFRIQICLVFFFCLGLACDAEEDKEIVRLFPLLLFPDSIVTGTGERRREMKEKRQKK
jgi:hypothetical protein